VYVDTLLFRGHLIGHAWYQPVLEFMDANRAWLWWMGAVSLATFIVALVLLPWYIGRLPADYFTEEYVRRKRARAKSRASVAIAVHVIRNIFALLLIIAGLAMLFLPGQGVLTVLLGVLLLTIPGKRPVMKWIACRHGVCGTLNWIRRKRGHPEFEGLPRSPGSRDGQSSRSI
jgi:hypothetical protein